MLSSLFIKLFKVDNMLLMIINMIYGSGNIVVVMVSDVLLNGVIKVRFFIIMNNVMYII